MKSGCYVCGSEKLERVFDAGLQPITNRFLKNPGDAEATYPLKVDQCPACGLMQTREPFPAAELQPAYDWVTYSEPEAHLDELADIILKLPGIGATSIAAGVSFKDDTTLDRLTNLGIENRWRLDLKTDLKLDWVHGGHGAETIQMYLTRERAAAVAAHRGAADVLLVRHIAEHAYNPKEFLAALVALTKPGGYIVIEVPDCQRALDAGDCTTLWEEHTLYFTPATFAQTLRLAGLEPVFLHNYIYPFENSLVAILRSAPAGAPDAAVAGSERARGQAFAAQLAKRREGFRRVLGEYRRSKGRIALFGAGHLASTFLTVMGVADLIDFVVDDNPNKRGLYMPGSHLPIVGSDGLRSGEIKLCLLGLNPLSEHKVMERQQAFIDGGGEFKSIFPSSAVALAL